MTDSTTAGEGDRGSAPPAASEVHSSYAMQLRWLGEKRALASAAGGVPELEVASPPQFGGPGGTWSPELLFVGAAVSCWLTTFLAIAGFSHLEVAAVETSAEGFVAKAEDKRFHVQRIVLRPRVTVRREEDRERANRLIQKAEDSCLIARSMRTAVEVAPEVVVQSKT